MVYVTWSISTTNGYVISITKLADAASLAARIATLYTFRAEPFQEPASKYAKKIVKIC